MFWQKWRHVVLGVGPFKGLVRAFTPTSSQRLVFTLVSIAAEI